MKTLQSQFLAEVETGAAALTPPLVRAALEALPAIIRGRGERGSRRFIEFFTASIRNRNTRAAYTSAVKQFLDWCDDRHLEIHDIDALTVAAYVLPARVWGPLGPARHELLDGRLCHPAAQLLDDPNRTDLTCAN